MTEFKVKDKRAAQAFVEALIGWTDVGVDHNGDNVSRPTSPALRAHLEAVLGEFTPNYGTDGTAGRQAALASYLRSVADAIDPIPDQAKLLEACAAKIIDMYRCAAPHGNTDDCGNRFADADETVKAVRAALSTLNVRSA